MSGTAEPRRGLSLRSQVVAGSVLLVSLPVLAAVVAALVLGARIAGEAAEDSLSRSRLTQEQLLRLRSDRLLLASRILASDPAFSSYVAATADRALGGVVDTVSLLDLLSDRRAELGFDLVAVLDPDGALLARTDRPGEFGTDLSREGIARPVLDDPAATAGLWWDGDRLYQAAAVPISHGFELIGFLLVAVVVDNRLADEIARAGGAEIVFMVDVDGGRVAVSTSLDASSASQIPRGPSLGDDRTLRLDEELWVARSDALLDASGAPLGFTWTLASRDRVMAPFRQIQRLVLIAGGLSLLLVFPLSFFMARRILLPVRRLARAAQAATGGDYSQDVEPSQDPDLARTAGAFNRLLVDLRERREMEAYLARIGRLLPLDSESVPASESGISPTRSVGGDEGSEIETVAAGTVIGNRYEIRRCLGAGGMGAVYSAHDRELGEWVALKFLHGRSVGLDVRIERIKAEIKAARRITHPNIVRTFDFATWDDVPFISMEYVRGLTLQQLLEHGALSMPAGLRLSAQVCAGLAAAHDAGILHRDIKPANVMIEPNGNAKLMDFGVAAHVGGRNAQNLAGTPLYLAPELFERVEPDERSDIYSLGWLLVEVFGGEHPHRGMGMAPMILAKQDQDPLGKAGRVLGLHPDLEAIVRRCVAPEPEDRYVSVQPLADALEALRREGVR